MMKASIMLTLLILLNLFSISSPVVAEENEFVIFSDANLEKVIRESLDKPTGDITKTDMEGFTSFIASDKGIADLTGLEYATNLQSLVFRSNQVRDIGPLANLTNLQKLWFSGNQVSDISPLVNLTSLQTLYFESNQVSDINYLKYLMNLQEIWFSRNEVSDINSLAKLSNLRTVGFSINQVRDISPLANLTNLRWVEFSSNQVSDISSLASLSNLQRLYITNNYIDISQGSEATKLIQSLLDKEAYVSYQIQWEPWHPEQTVAPEQVWRIDGKQFESLHIIDENDRTLVPVRILAQILGAEVEWHEQEKRVNINHNANDRVIDLWISRNDYTINNKQHLMETKAVIVNDRTFVPIMFIVEALGAEVMLKIMGDE